MLSNAVFLIFLACLCPIQAQFEFNDETVVREILLAGRKEAHVSCVTILRPPNEDHHQKAMIDRLVYWLARNVTHGFTIMSYTTEMYKTFYMDLKIRKTDTCVYWAAIVIASNSTTAQLAELSKSYLFDQPYWVIFANRSDISSVFHGVNVKLSAKIWTTRPLSKSMFIYESIFSNDSEVRGSVIWAKGFGVVTGQLMIEIMKIRERTLRVGTLQFSPYINVNRNQTGTITSVSGFYGDIWNDIQERLQIKSVYTEPKDGMIGSYDENGNWTGLYGMMVKGEIDVILGEMTISSSRYQIVDFLNPMERTTFVEKTQLLKFRFNLFYSYKLFYKKNAEIFDWLKVFRPLNHQVWTALIIWVIVGGIAAYVIIKFETIVFNSRKRISLISCIYFVLRALCNQGSEQVPKMWALRIFFLTAYLVGAVVLTAYSASLTSVLTLKTPVEPFEKLTDIVSTDFKLALVTNSTDKDYFQRSPDPLYRNIYEISGVKDTVATFNYPSAIQYTCNNHKTVFFGTINEIIAGYRQANISCILQPLKLEISSAYKTISVAKHSQYRNFLKNIQMRMLEYGLVERYKRLYINFDETRKETDNSISLTDVGALFIYLGILQTISTAILCFEHLSRIYRLH